MPIRFEKVSYTYGKKTPFEYQALKDINLEILEGSFTAIVGHTGSGKSTLIQHLNGLLLPEEGKVVIADFVLEAKKKIKNIKALRKQVGIVFQFPEYQLFESTVLKDVMFGPKNFGATEEEAKAKAQKALELVKIPPSYYEKSPFALSGGERRRVAIAGILAMEPKILVLDEPTAGLDPKGIGEMMHLFKEIHDKGTTVILVSHDMDVVLEYAEKVIVLQDGKVLKVASPTELFQDKNFESYSLEMPIVYQFAVALIKNGISIDLTKVKNPETLAKEIVKARDVK